MRILLDRGHGLNNTSRGIYDPGAVADDHSALPVNEASMNNVVAGLAYYKATMQGFRVVLTPELPLNDVTAWCNEAYEDGDVCIAIHQNCCGACGTGVLYETEAHKAVAGKMAEAMSKILGTKNLGAMPDVRRLAFLRNTKAPAFIFELGFIDSPSDMVAVILEGADAVVEAFKILKEELK